MSFIAKLFMPKMPSMPQIIMPEPGEVPNYDDEERKLLELRHRTVCSFPGRDILQ